MLAAKAVVFALLGLVVSAITVFAVFFITTAILRSRVSITLSQPGITRACIGGILYLTVLGLFVLAAGGLIRHTAGAIATVIALVLVVPPLISLIPGTLANHIHGYLPNVAGQLVAQSSQQPADVLALAGIRGPLPVDGRPARRVRLAARPPGCLRTTLGPHGARMPGTVPLPGDTCADLPARTDRHLRLWRGHLAYPVES